MEHLPHSKSCFVCGWRNPVGLKMRFRTDGKIVEGRFTPGPEHGGFLNVIHGGILATILDEVMVWACSVQTKKFCYCAEMSVRYLLPARPAEEIIATAEMVENRKNRILTAKGEIMRANGDVLTTSTGKYMPIRDLDLAPFYEDFEGTPDQLRKFLGHPGAAP